MVDGGGGSSRPKTLSYLYLWSWLWNPLNLSYLVNYIYSSGKVDFERTYCQSPSDTNLSIHKGRTCMSILVSIQTWI